jgi:hypothetical protein
MARVQRDVFVLPGAEMRLTVFRRRLTKDADSWD